MTLRVAAYDPNGGQAWDELVRRSKNGTFLFYRQFMDYHSDRFTDASALVYDDHRLVALMPASRHAAAEGDEIRSHGGLTYGGVICDQHMSVSLMLGVFGALLNHYRQTGAASLLYKAVPHVYHTMASEEDLYALFRCSAQLVRRDVAAAIDMTERPAVSKGRRGAIKQGMANAIVCDESHDWNGFISMETALLAEKYATQPAHTGDELALLHGRFPDHVRLFTASRDGRLLAGTVIFDTGRCAHAQYISSTREGRDLRALDVLFDWLLRDLFSHRRWFDFGISTEQSGRVLNIGLAENKESWGARSIVYDQYRIDFKALSSVI
jgi:hypothetical protein